ncbi:reverse transcriptase domain-containing protein, partial [Tanacetum coccineum]
EKVHQEKVQQENLKEVKACLNFDEYKRNPRVQEVSQHSESRTPNVRGEHRRGRRLGRSRSVSGSPERTSVFSRKRRDRLESPKHRPEGKGRRNDGVFNRLGDKGQSVSAHSESRYQIYRSKRTESIPRKRDNERSYSQRTEILSESEDSGGGHWKSKSKKQKSSIEDDDLSQPWLCEETDPFTSQDHLKIFQAAAKVKRWAMPTWCHVFNSTLTGSARVWFDDLPPESIDNYDDLKQEFIANFLLQKKCIKDSVEIHHIKQREKESTEDFVQRFKAESRHVK